MSSDEDESLRNDEGGPDHKQLSRRVSFNPEGDEVDGLPEAPADMKADDHAVENGVKNEAEEPLRKKKAKKSKKKVRRCNLMY